MKHLIKKHKKKVIYCAPIIFLVFLGFNLFSQPAPENNGENTVSMTANGTTSVPVDTRFSLDIMANAAVPINAIEATIDFPSDLLEITDITQEPSIVSLWAEEPAYTTASGTLQFSGGIIRAGGFTSEGKIITVTFHALKEGTANIQFQKAIFAKHDGKGTIIEPKMYGLTYEITEKTDTNATATSGGQSAPEEKPRIINFDMNGDGRVSISDVPAWLSGYFGPFNSKYDLNNDGKVNIFDLNVLFGQF